MKRPRWADGWAPIAVVAAAILIVNVAGRGGGPLLGVAADAWRAATGEERVAELEAALADARAERDTWRDRAEAAEGEVERLEQQIGLEQQLRALERRRAAEAEDRVRQLEVGRAGMVDPACVVTWGDTGECGSLEELIEAYNAAVAAEPDTWAQWRACLAAWEDPATGDVWPACSPIIPDLLRLAALLEL